MPRDNNGDMTLPAGNPFVSGTAISSQAMNATLADLAAEIEDSLSRTGKGGMIAAFRNAAGTLANPGITFDDDDHTGIRLVADGDMRLVASQTDVLKVESTGITVTGTIAGSGGLSLTGAVTSSSAISAPNTAKTFAFIDIIAGGFTQIRNDVGVSTATWATDTL